MARKKAEKKVKPPIEDLLAEEAEFKPIVPAKDKRGISKELKECGIDGERGWPSIGMALKQILKVIRTYGFEFTGNIDKAGCPYRVNLEDSSTHLLVAVHDRGKKGFAVSVTFAED